MTESISPPTLAEMEESLAHHGVKGMKWGVRRDDSGGSGGSGGSSSTKKKASGSPSIDVKAAAKKAPSPQMQAAAKTAKIASKKAVDYGVLPLAATAAGLAFPAAVVIGMATKALYDPHVQAAIKAGATYTAGLVSQIGDTTLSAMRNNG